MHVANYDDQRGALKRFALEAEGGAVFLTGKKEYGKSWLLEWLETDCKDDARIVRFEVNRKGRTATPTMIMNVCAQKLDWKYFREFLEERGRREQNHAHIQGATVNGSYNNLVSSAGASREDQVAIAIELTHFFLLGLQAAAQDGPPITICLDGCSDNYPLVADWLELSLIDSLVRDRSARLVIAQRVPPDESVLRRACKHPPIELKGVHETEEWIRLADNLGRKLTGADEHRVPRLEAIIEYARGEPGGIMTYLLGLPSRDEP